MHIHIHHHYDDELAKTLIQILQRLDKIMAAIDDLEASVKAEDTVIDGAVTLIQGIPALIAAAGVDPARLQALQNDINNKAQALAAAVATAPTGGPAANVKPAGA